MRTTNGEKEMVNVTFRNLSNSFGLFENDLFAKFVRYNQKFVISSFVTV